MSFSKSDHRPILLRLSNQFSSPSSQPVGKKSFRFEPFWIHEEEYTDLVSEVWSKPTVLFFNPSNPFASVNSRLEGCINKLRIWSHKKFGLWKVELKQKRERLETLFNSPYSAFRMSEIKKLELELEILTKHEESFWKQRSRVDWLKEGDRNTKFFHSKVNVR